MEEGAEAAYRGQGGGCRAGQRGRSRLRGSCRSLFGSPAPFIRLARLFVYHSVCPGQQPRCGILLMIRVLISRVRSCTASAVYCDDHVLWQDGPFVISVIGTSLHRRCLSPPQQVNWAVNAVLVFICGRSNARTATGFLCAHRPEAPPLLLDA